MSSDPTTVDRWYCRVHGFHGFTNCPQCRDAWRKFADILRRMNWAPPREN